MFPSVVFLFTSLYFDHQCSAFDMNVEMYPYVTLTSCLRDLITSKAVSC